MAVALSSDRTMMPMWSSFLSDSPFFRPTARDYVPIHVMEDTCQHRLPLDDVCVLDLTSARSGPVCVRHLADWGARVTRVEPPRGGGAEVGPRDGADFQNLHRHKRSMTLDLKSEEGHRIFLELAKRSDVVVENMRPRVKHRLRVDYDTVRAVNPRVVYGSISGYGQDGPGADRGGADQIAQGVSGLMSVTGFRDGPPVRTGAAITDVTSGILLALGIMIALHDLRRTGEGRWVQTSLLEAGLTLLDFQAARYTFAGVVAPREGNHHPTVIPMGCFETADGWINVAAWDGRPLQEFSRIVGLPELLEDPRYRDGASRVVHRDELNELIGARLATRTTAEWVAEFDAAGVPAGPVSSLDETFADPQVQHLGVAQPVPGREGRILRNAISLSGYPNEIRSASPAAGEHTDEVLAELGLAADEVARLREQGVV